MPCYVPRECPRRGVDGKNLERINPGLRTKPLASGTEPLAAGTPRQPFDIDACQVFAKPVAAEHGLSRESPPLNPIRLRDLGSEESLIALPCSLSGQAERPADVRPAVSTAEEDADLRLDRELSGDLAGDQEA